jgi:hypothetical protein
MLSSLPVIAAAAKMTASACAASPVLCANQAAVVVSDLLAGEALGGASLAGGAAGLQVLSKVEAEAQALRLIAQRNATLSAKTDNAILNRADALLYNDLAARAKIRPDTSMDAVYAAKTDRTILADNNFDMAHVLTGEINDRGRATGYHAEIAANGEARITPGATIVQNANGTYQAPVQIWDGAKMEWVDKGRSGSTFFPPSWSESRIAYEVIEAFKGKIADANGGWTGASPSGISIKIFWDPKNRRTTFYPGK